jgi:hypothetical protein
MALKKIRLVWSTPELPEGRWRVGLFTFQPIPDPARPSTLPSGALPSYWKKYLHHALHVSVRGLLGWGVAAALLAYFAGAALLWHRLERANPRNRVAYLDLVNPARWRELDRLRGEGLVLQGRDLLKRGEFITGFNLLRLGLEKNPAASDARLEVARLYAALRLRAPAEKLLLDGLAFGYPGRDYLEYAFGLAADADRPADWAGLALLARERLAALPADKRPAADTLWLDQQTVRALRAAGRPDEALALVETVYPADHAFRHELAVLHQLEKERPAEAAALAARWVDASPRSPEPLRLLVRAQREARDFAAMDAALERLRALDPAKPDPLLYALAQNHLAERADAARAALEELLFRHGATAPVYSAAAAVLVELRRPEGLDRLERELHERGLPIRPVLQARLQLAVARRDWSAVLACAEAVRADRGPAPADAQNAWLDTVARLARACVDNASGTQATLVEIVTDHPGTLRLYKLLLEALLDSGRPATARQILTLAEGPYQNARSIVALRARIESALTSTAAAAPAAASGPSPELASFPALAAAVEDRIRINDTSGALGLLASARRARPDWLFAHEPLVDGLELPLRARGDDPLRLQFLARAALAREPGAPDQLLALARRIVGEDPALRPNALLILKETLRRFPAHAETLGQLAAWEPRDARAPLDAPL